MRQNKRRLYKRKKVLNKLTTEGGKNNTRFRSQIMDPIGINKVLDHLAPSELIKPVKSCHNKPSVLVLDDRIVDAATKDLYVNGFQEEIQYQNPTPENLQHMFHQGIELLDSARMINVTQLALWKPSSFKLGILWTLL